MLYSILYSLIYSAGPLVRVFNYAHKRSLKSHMIHTHISVNIRMSTIVSLIYVPLAAGMLVVTVITIAIITTVIITVTSITTINISGRAMVYDVYCIYSIF